MERESRSIKERKANAYGNVNTPAGSNNSKKISQRKASVQVEEYPREAQPKRNARPVGGSNRKNRGRDADTIKKPNTAVQKGIGVFISVILLIAIGGFIWSMITLNMLPLEYMLILVAVLALIWLGIFARQIKAKKRATFTKFIAVLLTAVFGVASYYVYHTNNMISDITTASGLKIDEMAVVVLNTDPAEELADVANYTVGVQYSLNGDDVTQTVEHINETLGTTIETVEFTNVGEQAAALINGEIQALIYNEAYAGIIEEAYPEYPSMVKVVYTYEIEKIVEEKVVEGDITTDPFAVYISGIDVYGSISKTSRSDVNIVMFVNPSTRQILLVNTPRDYYLPFPGVTNGAKDKLTHAGIYGVDTSVNTLAELYQTDIEYYARVNFTSLIEIVDALGGIDVYSDQSFTTLHGNFKVNVGMNTFSGEQALGFARERYALKNGDNDRGKNQQELIKSMIQKAISPAIVTGATKIMASVSGNVDTDMPQEDIQALIKSQLSNPGSWNIKSMAATGTGDSQYCYSYSGAKLYVMQPNSGSVDKIKNAIQVLENGEVLTDEIVAQ